MPGFDQQPRPKVAMGEIEAEQETPLYGGNVTGAARIGQTVRRATGAWSTTVVPPADAVWQFTYPDHHQHEIICHGDFAPYNMIYRDGKPHALIDFDTAGPGPRLWDLAYAAYRFVPLSYAQDMRDLGLSDPLIQGPRLRLFCQAYGLEQPYASVLDFVERRLQAMCNWLSEGADVQEPTRQRLVNEGHLDYYRREIAAFQHHRPLLRRRLVS